MPSASLEDFLALNDQLAAAIDAGIPLGLELEADGEPEDVLAKINALVARQVSRGASLEEALEAVGPVAPAKYLSLALIWVRTGQLDAVLDQASQLAEVAQVSRDDLRRAFVYPLVVCGLALVGMAGFCLYVVPRLEGFREAFRLSLTSTFGLLEAARQSLPVWSTAAAVILACVAWLLWRRNRTEPNGRFGSVARLAGTAAANFEQRTAAFSSWLAMLLHAGVPQDEAMRLAADASGDRRLCDGAAWLAAKAPSHSEASGEHRGARFFPPFLTWALWQSQSVGRTEALELAADLYGSAAERHSRRARVVVPIVASVVIGGAVVLVYGVALFAPLAEMLRGVASSY
jgi:type II secretory pathway component PulF